jgi:hypothetical protein
MIKRGKIGAILLILFITLMPLVLSATVVRVDENQPPVEDKSPWTSVKNFFMSPYFWYGLIAILLIGLFGVCVFFFVKWLVKYFKERSDVFWLLKNDRVKFAKIQRRYPAKHFWRVNQNPPVRFVKNENGKPVITKPVGYYRGDYITNEGNHLIALNLENRKKLLFFPITDLLVIPNRKTMIIEQTDEKGKHIKVELKNIPTADEIVQFNENEVLIHADGITQMGFFVIPVIKTKEGKVIDLATPIFSSLREVVIGDFLYQQTSEFVYVAKKSMDLNPNLRYVTKSGDNNQSVEVPKT